MRIMPPSDEPYSAFDPIPKKVVPESEYIRVAEYLNVKPWICSDCKTKNFGRNEYCVYCKIRKGVLRAKG